MFIVGIVLCIIGGGGIIVCMLSPADMPYSCENIYYAVTLVSTLLLLAGLFLVLA